MLCTHAIYGFAGLDENTNQIKSLDPYNDLYDNYGKGKRPGTELAESTHVLAGRTNSTWSVV